MYTHFIFNNFEPACLKNNKKKKGDMKRRRRGFRGRVRGV